MFTVSMMCVYVQHHCCVFLVSLMCVYSMSAMCLQYKSCVLTGRPYAAVH